MGLKQSILLTLMFHLRLKEDVPVVTLILVAVLDLAVSTYTKMSEKSVSLRLERLTEWRIV